MCTRIQLEYKCAQCSDSLFSVSCVCSSLVYSYFSACDDHMTTESNSLRLTFATEYYKRLHFGQLICLRVRWAL
jgi:hypothetical protein